MRYRQDHSSSSPSSSSFHSSSDSPSSPSPPPHKLDNIPEHSPLEFKQTHQPHHDKKSLKRYSWAGISDLSKIDEVEE